MTKVIRLSTKNLAGMGEPPGLLLYIFVMALLNHQHTFKQVMISC